MVWCRRKSICLLMCFVLMFCTTACGSDKDTSDVEDDFMITEEVTEEATEEHIDEEEVAETEEEDSGILDLTILSSTMVYAEVYSMLISPEDYIGETVKMAGQFVILGDESGENIYTACLIYDALACCAQGMEFILAGDAVYPDDYPELYEEIVVTGTFETYYEGEAQYVHLVESVLE